LWELYIDPVRLLEEAQLLLVDGKDKESLKAFIYLLYY
jgi:hypothetical protein